MIKQKTCLMLLCIGLLFSACYRAEDSSNNDSDRTDSFDPNDTVTPDTDTGIASSRFKELSLGITSSCALDQDGNLACWGRATVSIPPSGKFKHVAMGVPHACAVREDASTTCWGGVDGPELDALSNPPKQAFVQLAMGRNWSCGLTEVGKAFCWGVDAAAVNDVQGETFARIAAGENFACGLSPQGRITCWGENEGGQTSPPHGAFRSITADEAYACALSEEGRAVCWGKDNYDRTLSPAPDTFSQLASPWCGLMTDGLVKCWNKYEPYLDQFHPKQRFLSIAASRSHMCGVTDDDELICWGDDYAGQATPNDFLFQQLATNGNSFCGLTVADDLVCWGDTGLKPSGKGPYQQVQMGAGFICAQRIDGAVECQKRAKTFVEVFAADLQITQFDCAKETCCAVPEDGTVHCWPEAPAEQPPQTALKVTASPLCAILQDESISCYMDGTGWSADGVPAGAFKDLSASGSADGTDGHRCGLRTDGEIVCWGENNLGQCDAPSGAYVKIDVCHFSNCDEMNVCSHSSVSCAVGENGPTRCWGARANGLYENLNVSVSSAVARIPTAEFSQVVVGTNSACALRKNGRVACWGDMVRGLNRDDFE